MSEVRLNATGWRLDDMRVLWQHFNRTAIAVAEATPTDAATVSRRLLVLSGMFRAVAEGTFERDPEAEAEQICDQFWSRRRAGHRPLEDDDDDAD